jgi:hypothetical protein
MIGRLSSNRLFSVVRRQANKDHSRRGATVVEFALTFLLFLLIILTMLEIGRGIWTYTTLAQAARQAGRYAIVRGSENPTTLANIRTVVERHARGLEGSRISINAAWNPSAETPNLDPAAVNRGDIVEIKLIYPFQLVSSPIVLAQSTVMMSSTTRMVVAN